MNGASKAVFSSYASEEAGAARGFRDALRAAGMEVWFEQSELRGGDAWDARLRGAVWGFEFGVSGWKGART